MLALVQSTLRRGTDDSITAGAVRRACDKVELTGGSTWTTSSRRPTQIQIHSLTGHPVPISRRAGTGCDSRRRPRNESAAF
jgi:hypothetical protein